MCVFGLVCVLLLLFCLFLGGFFFFFFFVLGGGGWGRGAHSRNERGLGGGVESQQERCSDTDSPKDFKS